MIHSLLPCSNYFFFTKPSMNVLKFLSRIQSSAKVVSDSFFF